ncbi:MAG: hypothetical protein QMC73_02640 [Myxococcota bacterium]
MRTPLLSPKIFESAAAMIAAVGYASSGSSPRETMPNEFAGAPSWGIKGYVGEPAPTKLCGVGSFKGSSKIALARTAAKARGRTAIALSLGLEVESILKDYLTTVSLKSRM